MNVHFDTIVCQNTTAFVGMDVRFCTMKIHDSMIICKQTMFSIVVVHLAIVQSGFCICMITGHPMRTVLHKYKFTFCCCNSGTTKHKAHTSQYPDTL